MFEKKIFDSLDLPKKDGVLKAKALKKHSRFYLCKSSDGCINFLIKTNGKTDSNSYKLNHIDISHNQNYQVEENNKNLSIMCTHIKCKSDSINISNIFFEQIHSLASIIKEDDSDKLVGKKLDNLIEIFKSLNKKSIKTIRGLWAELFVINMSSNVKQLMEAWHQDEVDRYDFSSNLINLEIKSRSKLKPVDAHFSNNQAYPPRGSKKTMICSVYVNSNSSGLSILNLKDEISQKIKSPSLKKKLETNFYKILGDNINNDEINLSYDAEIASKNCLIFDLDKIPKIPNEDIPPEIISFSFKVDLTNIPSINFNKIKKYPLLKNLKNIIT